MDNNTIDEKILTLLKYKNPDDPLKYINDLTKGYCIDKLENKLLECKKCCISDFNAKSINSGNINSGILVINEDIPLDLYNEMLKDDVDITFAANESFMNKFKQYCNLIGANYNYLFFIRCVNCFIGKIVFNKETGKEEIVKALSTINNEEKINCFQFFLDKYIDVIKPYVIITLGSFASNMLFSVANNNTGNKFALMRDHGKVFKYKNIDVIPTYSSSFLDNKNNKMTVDEITQLKYNFVTDLYNAFTLEKQINYKSGIGNIKLP